MRNENGMTLLDLLVLAESKSIDPSKIFLLTSDYQPITEVDFSDDFLNLWFLGDE